MLSTRALPSRTLVICVHTERVIVGSAAAIRDAEKRVDILVRRLHRMRFARVAAVSDRFELNERRETQVEMFTRSNHSEQITRAPVRAKSRARCREGSRCALAGRLECLRSRAYAGTLRRPRGSAQTPPTPRATDELGFFDVQPTLPHIQRRKPQVTMPNKRSSETPIEERPN